MIKKLFSIALVLSIFSCGNESKTDTANTKNDSAAIDSTKEQTNELADFKFHTLVINIESPLEIVSQLPKAKLAFNKELINSTDNEKKYTTSTKKGLNYGVYIADLVYLSSNEQYSDIKNYFQTTRNLAKSLDCVESLDNIAGARLEKNIDNKDTINKIVDQIYFEMDNYLRTNDRLLTATQILVGSWVESQYITASLIKDQAQNDDNKILFEKVTNQNFAIEKLIGLLKEFEKEKDLKDVTADLISLKELNDSFKNKDIDQAATIKAIYEKLKVMRTKIVS